VKLCTGAGYTILPKSSNRFSLCVSDQFCIMLRTENKIECTLNLNNLARKKIDQKLTIFRGLNRSPGGLVTQN
jgi:hypothetical protein